MQVGDDPPSLIPGHVGSVWRHFWLSCWEAGGPGTWWSSPGVWLNIYRPQDGWQHRASQPSVSSARLEKPVLAGYTMLWEIFYF